MNPILGIRYKDIPVLNFGRGKYIYIFMVFDVGGGESEIPKLAKICVS